MPYMTKGSSKASGVYSYVCLLTTFLKISWLDLSFFYIGLRIFNLQDLMQSNFRGRFIFAYKGTKIKISLLIFLGLIVSATRRRKDIKMLLCLLALVQKSLI